MTHKMSVAEIHRIYKTIILSIHQPEVNSFKSSQVEELGVMYMGKRSNYPFRTRINTLKCNRHMESGNVIKSNKDEEINSN